MALEKIKVIASKTRRIEGALCYPKVFECVCDRRDEVENVTFDSKQFLQGTTIFCIQDSSRWMVNSNSEAVPVSGQAGAYGGSCALMDDLFGGDY